MRISIEIVDVSVVPPAVYMGKKILLTPSLHMVMRGCWKRVSTAVYPTKTMPMWALLRLF